VGQFASPLFLGETVTLEERFWAKVDKTDSCWNWLGGTNKQGYGKISYGGYKNEKSLAAHRVSYQLANGEIPEGMFVLHSCDNPRCVNPEHLFVGTRQDNVDDRERKGRNKIMRGDRVGTSVLTNEQVAAIKRSLLDGESIKDRSARYSVHRRTISGIKNEEIWQSIHPLPPPPTP
jgi:hypothetical protein